MLTIARAEAVPVSGSREQSFKILGVGRSGARAERRRTRGLVLDSPSNPTGAVYSRAELEEISAFANEALGGGF